jgi:hypothetical protein
LDYGKPILGAARHNSGLGDSFRRYFGKEKNVSK